MVKVENKKLYIVLMYAGKIIKWKIFKFSIYWLQILIFSAYLFQKIYI